MACGSPFVGGAFVHARKNRYQYDCSFPHTGDGGLNGADDDLTGTTNYASEGDKCKCIAVTLEWVGIWFGRVGIVQATRNVRPPLGLQGAYGVGPSRGAVETTAMIGFRRYATLMLERDSDPNSEPNGVKECEHPLYFAGKLSATARLGVATGRLAQDARTRVAGYIFRCLRKSCATSSSVRHLATIFTLSSES